MWYSDHWKLIPDSVDSVIPTSDKSIEENIDAFARLSIIVGVASYFLATLMFVKIIIFLIIINVLIYMWYIQKHVCAPLIYSTINKTSPIMTDGGVVNSTQAPAIPANIPVIGNPYLSPQDRIIEDIRNKRGNLNIPTTFSEQFDRDTNRYNMHSNNRCNGQMVSCHQYDKSLDAWNKYWQ